MAELFKKKSGKKFSETAIGKIAKAVVPQVLSAADQLFMGGKITDAINLVRKEVSDKAETGDAEAKVYLTEIDIKFKELENELQRIYLEEMKIEVEDRKDARAMRNEFTRLGKIDWEHMLLNVVAILAFFGVVGYLLFKTVPTENR